MAATVYVVGAGPGDPGLLTLRGRDALARAQVVLYDGLVDPTIVALAPTGAEKVDVGKTPGSAHAEQEAINARMIAESRAGRVVVRLKAGDPYLFARGSEEVEALSRAGVPFEVVPGVSSAVAAAAYAGIPLTHRHHASSVVILTGHGAADGAAPVAEFTRLATVTGTLVVLMGMRHIAALAQALVAGGRAAETPVAVVRWASRPQQETLVSTLAEVAEQVARAGISAPAVIVVGQVVSLRESLRWFDRLPLFGKKVLCPRAAEQAASLSALLREQGALPLEVPAIRFEPPEDPAILQKAIAELGQVDLVVFTSANAVRWFWRALRAEGADARRFGRAEICAVGPGTAEALEAHGLHADLVPVPHHAEAAAEAIVRRGSVAGRRVLQPRAAKGRQELSEILRAAGARVDVVPVYRTLPPDEAGRAALEAAAQEADVVVFTSGSTVDHFLDALGQEEALRVLASRLVASIGPATSDVATRAGVRVDIVAQSSTVHGLVTALVDHFGEGGRG